jgi:hypothetical protein
MKVTSRQARKLAGRRQTYAGGRPRIPRPCPRCGAECVSARQAQAHCAAPEPATIYIQLASLSRQIRQRREDVEKCWPEGASRRKLAELLHWIEAELEVILHERELDKPAGNT